MECGTWSISSGVSAASARSSAMVTMSPGPFSRCSWAASLRKRGWISVAATSAISAATALTSGDFMRLALVQQCWVTLFEPLAVVGGQPDRQAGAAFVVVALQHFAMLVEPGDVAAAIMAQ